MKPISTNHLIRDGILPLSILSVLKDKSKPNQYIFIDGKKNKNNI